LAVYYVKNFFEKHGAGLELELCAGQKGLNRSIVVPEAHRPGLSLAGYFKGNAPSRILVFGKIELEYLRSLNPKLRLERLRFVIKPRTPAVFVARRCRPPNELIHLCEELGISLFKTPLSSMKLLSRLTNLLTEEFAPRMSCHGTLVEVFGMGLLLKGDSAVGKSEAALGLLERGHRLISDDVVRVIKREGKYLEGFGAELTRHHMEIRGIGIINVANLYGAVCVRDQKSIDIVVKMEVWDDAHFYDRIGLEEKFIDILGVNLPYLVLPVKPGRDIVMLLETIALNHRLKRMGYNSAQEFSSKVLALTMQKKVDLKRKNK
jgi:HPr kinase/phosphorylase